MTPVGIFNFSYFFHKINAFPSNYISPLSALKMISEKASVNMNVEGEFF